MTPRVVALVAAHDEDERIADTVTALRKVAGVDAVIVADDGSTDRTAEEARSAGATVWRRADRLGKGRALEGALRLADPADVWLFADADLGVTANGLDGVLAEVLEGRAELAVAAFPVLTGGGFGIVKRAARSGIRALTGFDAREPLSGQRAITASCLEACRPLARGFGVEVAMTIDALRGGFRVQEIDVPGLSHRPTGRNARGFLHRGRQGLDIAAALAARALGLR